MCAYVGLGLGLVVAVFGRPGLGRRVGVHVVLKLPDLLRQLLQRLHDVRPLLGLHPSVVLQPVYQGLAGDGRAVRENGANGKKEKERR